MVVKSINPRDISIIDRLYKKLEINKIEGKHSVIAAIVNKKKVLCYGFNSYEKTHPMQPQKNQSFLITKHAEVDCLVKFISNWGIDELKYCTMYVVAVTRAKDFSNYSISSKPCAGCMNIIEKAKIKRIVYHENKNQTFQIKTQYLNNQKKK